MKMQSQALLFGIESSKGEFQGTAYDSTKFHLSVDMEALKKNSFFACGQTMPDGDMTGAFTRHLQQQREGNPHIFAVGEDRVVLTPSQKTHHGQSRIPSGSFAKDPNQGMRVTIDSNVVQDGDVAACFCPQSARQSIIVHDWMAIGRYGLFQSGFHRAGN